MIQIDGLPTGLDIVENVNAESKYVYGFLVLALLAGIYFIWRKMEKDIGAYRDEVKNLRAENKEQVETMLKISSESIPILTSAAEALKEKNGTNAIILASLEKLQNDHRLIIDHVRK